MREVIAVSAGLSTNANFVMPRNGYQDDFNKALYDLLKNHGLTISN